MSVSGNISASTCLKKMTCYNVHFWLYDYMCLWICWCYMSWLFVRYAGVYSVSMHIPRCISVCNRWLFLCTSLLHVSDVAENMYYFSVFDSWGLGWIWKHQGFYGLMCWCVWVTVWSIFVYLWVNERQNNLPYAVVYISDYLSIFTNGLVLIFCTFKFIYLLIYLNVDLLSFET